MKNQLEQDSNIEFKESGLCEWYKNDKCTMFRLIDTLAFPSIFCLNDVECTGVFSEFV